MDSFDEVDVSRAILDAYHAKFAKVLRSDVVVVGAGPSGLVAGWKLAQVGRRVCILEKRLSPGGGIWGGSLGMNEIALEKEALDILDEMGVAHQVHGRLFTADAMQLSAALILQALRAGATILNLMMAEDLCVRSQRVTGVVANRSLIGDQLPVDPIVFSAKAVIDATGHEAVLAKCLQRRGLLRDSPDRLPGEGPMDAPAGERFVVDRVAELYPGLWMTGMSVSASLGGPRMGAIFGGMLLSGKKVAASVEQALAKLGPEAQGR
ncbi:thiazole biosynthesis protein [Candidatus Sumerlaeota bacterium]|nr:thiazole biosynthesis protein [Candidatus Sumerlaeota bacterium]